MVSKEAENKEGMKEQRKKERENTSEGGTKLTVDDKRKE